MIRKKLNIKTADRQKLSVKRFLFIACENKTMGFFKNIIRLKEKGLQERQE